MIIPDWRSVGFPPLVLSDPLFQTTMFLSTFPAPKINDKHGLGVLDFVGVDGTFCGMLGWGISSKLPDKSATRCGGFSQPPVEKTSRWISFSLNQYYRVERGKYYMTIWWLYDDYMMMTILIKSQIRMPSFKHFLKDHITSLHHRPSLLSEFGSTADKSAKGKLCLDDVTVFASKWGLFNGVFWISLSRRGTSWWFQPIWKILVKLDHFPR